jgi:outer membrane lipoprotein-sorting protein
MRAATLFLCLLAASSAWSQDPVPPALKGTDKVAAVLARVAEAQSRVSTITARFEQVRESRLLVAPSVSHGVFYFASPDSVRWEYQSPRVMQVVIAGGVAITYRPEEKRAERVEIGRMQRRVFRFLGAGEPLDTLKRYFSFTFRDAGEGRDYEFLLDPATAALKRRLQRVEVRIDRARFIPVAVSYVEADGDRNAYTFHDVILNQPVREELFALQLPADVAVVDVKLASRE